MDRRHSARQALRQATAADHDAVDRVFSTYNLTDRADYAAFLMAQAAAFLPVEAAIERSRPTRVLHDWPTRRRACLLAADLAALDVVVPVAAVLPPFDSDAALLGAVYVLEGSRLGGRVLAREVADGLPKTFLGAGHPSLWRSLLDLLEAELATAERRAMAVTAARMVFALFEKGACCRPHLPS